MEKLEISEINILPVKPQNGLVAFASFIINNQIYVGNVAIHQSPIAEGGYRLLFPDRVLPNGKRINCVHPITREAGEQIRKAVIQKFEELVEDVVNKYGAKTS